MIVITGAAGMIGSGVVRYLNDIGETQLLLVDDFQHSDKWKNLVGKQFVNLIPKEDIWNALALHQEDIQAVIHLGACSDTLEKDVDFLLENNFRFSQKLSDWALSHNKRFIYASSAATYGDGSLGFSDEDIERLRPMNPYAFSKQLFDLWLLRNGGLKKAVGLKYFNVFGPNEYHKGHMASMIFKMVPQVQERGSIALYQSHDGTIGHGEQSRDFIYAKDAARRTCLFLRPEYATLAGIFNIARGEAVTWNQMAQALFQALDRPANIQYIEMPLLLQKQYQVYTCAQMAKWHTHFQDTSYSIEEAVREYVQDYLVGGERW